MVAGALFSSEAPGPQQPQNRWQRPRAYAAAWALHCSMSTPVASGPQKRLMSERGRINLRVHGPKVEFR